MDASDGNISYNTYVGQQSSTLGTDQCTFVVENLERHIRESHKSNSSPSEESQDSMQSNTVPDTDVLASLEGDIKSMSQNISEMLRDLRVSLHGMSSLTVETTECFWETISTTCDAVDTAIKNIYTMLAKVGHFLVTIRFNTGKCLYSGGYLRI